MKITEIKSIKMGTLKFGKFKGYKLSDTPEWYKKWLLQQDWFEVEEKPLHQQLNNWDGHSKKGEAIYDAIFEDEKIQSAKMDCLNGICECCNTSKYYGL